MNLAALRDAADAKRTAFHAAIESVFPGMDQWHWFRACAAMRGENVRRNGNTSHDSALAGNVTVREAFNAYITALHTFYRARDGEQGVLGGRGLSA